MRLFLLAVCFSLVALLPFAGKAQDMEQDTVNLGYQLHNEMAGNIMAHTLGYGVGFRFGRNRTYYNNRMFEFDLLEMKAPNQQKRYNINFPNPRSYCYGKLNALYIFRAGIGEQRVINRKPYWGGVEVRFFYYGGLSIGIAKPVYLKIAYYSYDPGTKITYYDVKDEKYDPAIHFPDRGMNPTTDCDIYGRASVFKGFNQLKPYPGLYGKTGLNFEFGKQSDRIQALEAGVALDFFPKAIPVMAFSDPYRFFLTGYLSFHFGKRYN